MIRSITLDMCEPYVHSEMADCRKVNFVYGANGSGKSTIGVFLSGNGDTNRFSSSRILWDGENHEPIFVYNKEFRLKNFQETIPGVFTMGNATIEDIKALEQLKEERASKQSELDKRTKSLQSKQDDRAKLETGFGDFAWKSILKPYESDFQKAFAGFRNSKANFLSELRRRIGKGVGVKCDRLELKERAKRFYAEDKIEKVQTIKLDVESALERLTTIKDNPIWKTAIVGDKDINIASLITELNNSSWVSEGRAYLRQGSSICPFCQQGTITEDFREQLESFFNKEYEENVAKMSSLRTEYQELVDSIVRAVREAVTEEGRVVGKLNDEDLELRLKAFQALAAKSITAIEEKIAKPEIRIELQCLKEGFLPIEEAFHKANMLMEEWNRSVDNYADEVERLTNDAWATVIFENKPAIDRYLKDIDNAGKAVAGMNKGVTALREEVQELDKNISEKGKNITSVQPAVDEINKTLRAYGFDSFSIQRAPGVENHYCIMRKDGSLALDSLSEGEETFLTFLYFMQLTKGSMDQTRVSDKKIIVLDDPISSLDSTILYIVSVMVRELSSQIREGKGDVNQLFVFTHNVFFHKEASFIDMRTSETNDVHYWIIRKNEGVSTISPYGKSNPISTSYELLWRELRDNSGASVITIQNTMRRIIEFYFRIIGNSQTKDDKLIACFKSPEEQRIARSLIGWINDGSHSIPDDLYIDSYSDSVSKYKEVFKKLFEKSGHGPHYNMMMGTPDE